MLKIKMFLIAIVAMFGLSGCFITTTASYITDTVCDLTPGEQLLTMEKMDKATNPNKLRVECN